MTQVFTCQIDESSMGEEDEEEPMSLSLRRKPKVKSIEYGPAPKFLVEAVRKQLRLMIDMPDLDANLGNIGRFAMQSDDMLTIVKAPKAIMRDEHAVTLPGTPDMPPNIETYGANFLRTLVAEFTAHQNAGLQSPEMLVSAIAAARRDGMPDVAAALEKKLLGKGLDGARPVGGTIAALMAEHGIEMPAPEAPRRGKGRRKKTPPPDAVNGHAHQNGATP
jgi:hypothetical protein